MPEKRVLNIVTSRQDAHHPDKKHWTQHGILIIGSNSYGEERITLKLNSLPIAADFDGWFSVFPREEAGHGYPTKTNSSHRFQSPPIADYDDYDDEIPFN